LQHVERLAAAAFANDHAVGAHAQSVAHEVANRNRAAAFNVGRTRLQSNDMRLHKPQFGRVFDGDNAVGRRNEAAEHIEERRFS